MNFAEMFRLGKVPAEPAYRGDYMTYNNNMVEWRLLQVRAAGGTCVVFPEADVETLRSRWVGAGLKYGVPQGGRVEITWPTLMEPFVEQFLAGGAADARVGYHVDTWKALEARLLEARWGKPHGFIEVSLAQKNLEGRWTGADLRYYGDGCGRVTQIHW